MMRLYLHKLKSDVVVRELFLLIVIGGLYSFGIFLSNTFVNVYLWRQSTDFQTIAMYNLSIVIFQVISFYIAGALAKKIDRIIIFRIGVIFLSVFFITVLLLGENAAMYHLLLGSLLGVGYGFYWLAFNVLTFEVTEPNTRDVYNGIIGALESISGMFGPLLAGIIIAKFSPDLGYMVVFTISLSFFILAVICSFFLKARAAKGKYELAFVIKEIKRNKHWQAILFANFFQGLREGIFMFLIVILLFITTQDEFRLGLFNFALYGLSFILYIYITKKVKKNMRTQIILVGTILISLSVVIIVFEQSFMTFILYAIIIGIAHPMVNVPINSLSYDVIGRGEGINRFRIEYIVVLEFFSNFGRIISIVSFLIGLKLFGPMPFIIIILVMFSPAYLFIYFFVRKINNGENV